MLKILYAAQNNPSSKIQLSRFLKETSNYPYNIKIAAYKLSSPDINIDWTLDALLNMFNPNKISLNNDNFSIYYNQIKSFGPDLIISDLEYFTSHIANLLDIPLWQCSSSIINFGLTVKEKYDLGIFKNHSFMFHKDPMQAQRIGNMIDNSNKNYIYSHFGDCENIPQIRNNFEWVRPYHQIGRKAIPCAHDIICALQNNNKCIINILKQYNDTVVFTNSYHETYDNVILKDIANEEEYFCNLYNSYIMVCEGQASFLADAFYNGKPSSIYLDINNVECIINDKISKRLKLSTNDVESAINLDIKIKLNNDIGFLHEKIARFDLEHDNS